MNNSMLDSLPTDGGRNEVEPKLRSEESRIVRIIEALREVQQSKSWKVLSEEVFDPLTNILEKNLKLEAREEEVNLQTLNRLAGELKWAERYSDLSKLENSYKVQLKHLRIKLYGKDE